MALPHCSPPRVPEWQLSAWPERDPDCDRCGAEHTPEDHQQFTSPVQDAAMDRRMREQGTPTPVKTDRAHLELDNMRMLATMGEPAPPPQVTPAQLLQTRLAAFEMFQHFTPDNEKRMYVFDLEQAFGVAGLDADEDLVVQMRCNFDVLPGDKLTFEQFLAMCDLVETMPKSPPRDHGDAVPMPGSPDYKVDKPEKPKPLGKPAKNPVPYHMQMDRKVEVPEHVRIQHGFHRSGK